MISPNLAGLPVSGSGIVRSNVSAAFTYPAKRLTISASARTHKNRFIVPSLDYNALMLVFNRQSTIADHQSYQSSSSAGAVPGSAAPSVHPPPGARAFMTSRFNFAINGTLMPSGQTDSHS